MKQFILTEIKMAVSRLRNFTMFLLKCMLAAFINLMFLIAPVALSLCFFAQSFAGWLQAKQPNAASAKSIEMMDPKPPIANIAERLRFLNRDLQAWISTIRRIKN